MTEVKTLTADTFDTFAAVVEEINEQQLGLETIQRLRKDFDQGRYAGFLLYEASALAGIAIVVDSYSAIHARTVLCLDELYIRAPLRRKALGKRLFDHVIEYAKARGYMRLEWLVEKDNVPAEALYSNYDTDTTKKWYGMEF